MSQSTNSYRRALSRLWRATRQSAGTEPTQAGLANAPTDADQAGQEKQVAIEQLKQDADDQRAAAFREVPLATLLEEQVAALEDR